MNIPQPVAISKNRMHPQTLPAHVHLKVVNLPDQILFYQHAIGLQLNWHSGMSAGMGIDGRDLVRLTRIQEGKRYRGVTGLYHFAILFPNRRELAIALARLYVLKWTNYPTDHVMTKTTYLDDPEGNNIELYCESPEDGIFMFDEMGNAITQHADGRLSDGREPLDINALFAHLTDTDRLDLPVPSITRIGHFHIYVSNMEETRHFYHELLGFDDMGMAQRMRMGMVSAGGYHHHIGYNTWQGEGAPPPPEDAVGLIHYAFNLPNQEELNRLEDLLNHKRVAFESRSDGLFLRDPSQNGLLFTTAELGGRPAPTED